MQRVEDGRLWVGHEGRAEKDIRIPERNAVFSQCSGCEITVGVEVVQNIAAGQRSIGEEQSVVEQPNE